jgi:alkylation response protein AidB-like acyl-CoA dehydrogenase
MRLGPQDEAFREEVRAFFAAELTPELRRAGKLMTSVYADHESQMAWQAKLHAKGWAAPAWPVEYGGCNWSIVQHHIFASERVRAGAPPVSPMGIKMCGPAIIGFGTDAQKAFFLPRMLSGEHFWCQGYSEPGAGSDLAALQMKAVRDGDDFICTGTKIWTTHAHVANWIFCLVRTAKTDRKQQGITFLLIDMTSPGIEVRPIIMASGEHIQNQIFFDNVRVPVANILGEIDNGWTVAKYLLEFERGGSAYAPEIEVGLKGLLEQVATLPAGPSRALLEAKIAEARIRCDILARLEGEILSRLSAGAHTGADASMMKILGTELQQRVTELALEAAGPLARAFQPGVAMPGGPIPGHDHDDYCSGEVWQAIAPLRYLNERAGSIYAGTNEIQRNILAKAELGI